jgi:hypothetical protein
MVLKFMELCIPILHIFWNKVEIALSAYHIRENTHLAVIQQNIRTTFQCIIQTGCFTGEATTFHGKPPVELFCVLSHTTT